MDSKVIAMCFLGVLCAGISAEEGIVVSIADDCMVEAETGMCRAYIPSFFYNASSEMCEKFIYGGCGGNANRFPTLAECEDRCARSQTVDGNLCAQTPEKGECRGNIPRYYYDPDAADCQQFIYGGCGGNDNNFLTKEECEDSCMLDDDKDKDPCLLKPEQGPCKAIMWQFYYNYESDSCGEFAYGGCGGNSNRFASKQMCEDKCLGTNSATPSALSSFITVIFFSVFIWMTTAN